jgi:hypothetical protein
MPGIKRYRDVGIAIDGWEDEEKVRYCSECMKVHVLSILKQRLYLDDKGKSIQPLPPDAEDWLQCWTCGFIVAAQETKSETKLQGISGIEPIENPFDFGKTIIEPIYVRQDKNKPDFNKMKKELAKLNIKDPLLRKELAAGAELISYEET